MAPSINFLYRYLSSEGSKQSIKHLIAETRQETANEAINLLKYGCIPWDCDTCLAVVCYVNTFCLSPEHILVSQVITVLEDLAFKYDKSRKSEWRITREAERKFTKVFVKFFVPMARKFFSVPSKEEKDKDLQRNEILAGFIHFLSQVLLHYQEDAEGDLLEKPCDILQKELQFLLTYLGDAPFRCTNELHKIQVSILLQEFEILANEAGAFIYSCIFLTLSVNPTRFYEANALFRKVELLNANIKQHCIKFSKLPVYVTSRPDVVDSNSIVTSVVEDLENMMNGGFNFTNSDCIEKVIIALHDELKKCLEIIRVPRQESILEIRELAYDAEYLVSSYVIGNIQAWYLNLRLPAISQKIKIARARLTEMDVSQVVVGSSVGEVMVQTTDDDNLHYVSNSVTDLEKMIRCLNKHRNVILIHGMAGVGKTTLARKFYNSVRNSSNRFDRFAWCIVSQTFDKKKILNEILKNVKRDEKKDETPNTENNDTVDVAIHKILHNRRYLIVLDDVWDRNPWDELGRYFPDDENGSRVILTSRSEDAVPAGNSFYTPPILSDDECWDLLEKKAFQQGRREPCLELRNIGKRIAGKCSGIPLAVVTAAGILVNLKETGEWEKVEKQFEESLLSNPSNYRRTLELSYEHLPYNIKPCFLFLAAFPEDAEIPVKKLLWWWISQGFIPKEEKSPEEIAKSYLLNLITRSLLSAAKRGSDGSIKTCRIHDLLHDMCIRKADEVNFLKYTKEDFTIYQKHQHLCGPSAYWRPFGPRCRSLIGDLTIRSSCFQTMPLLKVMDFLPDKYYHSNPIKHDIPVQLRYLGDHLMPKEMTTFVNLEFLWVENGKTVSIPSAVLRMAKLRHLFIKREAVFENGHKSSEKPNHLIRSVSYVRIYKQEDEKMLKCLPNLNKLNCRCGSKIAFPDIRSLEKLESLKMKFRISSSGKQFSNFDFPKSITKLCLRGSRLSWEKMTVIGSLPNLLVLKLKKQAFVGDEWQTLDGEFTKLRFLKIEETDLKQWNSCSDDFPSLECLVLTLCSELLEIPSDLGGIATLQSIQVRHLSKEASLSALEIQEKQHEYGNDELKVMVISIEWTKEELALEYKKRNEVGTTECHRNENCQPAEKS